MKKENLTEEVRGKSPVVIPEEKLHTFNGHPYKVQDNVEMDFLIESIQTRGILSPLIVRPLENTTDEYEVISGHRRLHAARKAGIKTVPAFIYPISRNDAAIMVVDSNLHREHILPSEKAFAYKLKYEALKHQGTSSQLETKQRSDEILGVDSGESRAQIQRYIRLTYLIPNFLEMMDEGKIALSVGVELSFLDEQSQGYVLDMCRQFDCTPSYSQSWNMHRLYREGSLNYDSICEIMRSEKANQRETVKVPMERLRTIIPSSFTVKQAEDFLIKAAEYYRKYLEKQKGRGK